MTTEEIIGQIIGLVATALTLISYQMNTKRGVMAALSFATACTCLSFLFFGASSGFFLNIVCFTRNIFFYFQKEGSVGIYISTTVFIIAMAVLGAFSWQGYFSLLIIIALMINTFFMSLGNPQILRYSILFTSTLVLIYNVYVMSIGGIANEGISIVSSAVGILRFRQGREGKSKQENQSES